MSETASIKVKDQEIELPLIEGTEGEVAIDISTLRAKTGIITFDNGYGNTGSCQSAITFLDGEKGILRYRGYSIEDLVEKSRFIEVAYLLIYGELPSVDELESFEDEILHHTMIHEGIKKYYDVWPHTAHPMALLSSVISGMSTYYPGENHHEPEAMRLTIIRLLAKLPTVASWAYKNSIGQPIRYPRNELSYCSNFLNMMFSVPSEEYNIDPDVERALNELLIIHADHEQNCSTSTVRLVGSSHANLYASIAAGILGLWGPLHGGANQAVLAMLQTISDDGGNIQKYIAKAKDKKDPFRLMGFGHRVYKNFDPRAKLIKKSCDTILNKMGINDPLLDLAKQLEEVALRDEYFIEKKLYPNVDFYSGLIYRAIGFPTNMFTVLFAIGRLPGWIAQWKELVETPGSKIGRPRQVYQGNTAREYVPLGKRR